jgi:hypothetical protein
MMRFACLTIFLVACAHEASGPVAGPADDGFPSASRTAPTPPSLVVDAQSVTLDGVKVADAPALAALQEGESAAVVKAFKHRPFFTPELSFEVKTGASTRAAVHALYGAWAAKATNVHFVGTDVVARNGSADVRAPIHTLLRIDVDRDGARLSWLTDSPCEKAPHGARVSGADLAASIAGVCGATACIDQVYIFATEDVPFDRIVSALGAASKEGTAKFNFGLSVSKDDFAETSDVCGQRILTSLAPEEIQLIVRADFGAFRACYEDALKRDPKVAGRIAIYFEVGRDGHVSEARTQDDSTFREAQATACILDRMRRLVFPSRVTEGKTTVVYPIIFSPDKR